MTFEQFRAKYGKRLLSYVRGYCRKIGAEDDFRRDLEQTAWLTVHRKLPYWDATRGQNPFNYCAPSILSEMWYEWRRYNGHKPYAAGPIEARFCELEPEQVRDTSYETMDAVCDMRRAFAAYPRPAHLVRFVMVALSPASAAELGRNIGLTRQAVSSNARVVRRQLRAALGGA